MGWRRNLLPGMTEIYEFISDQWFPQPIDDAFAFFSQPHNLEQITPPWLRFHVVRAENELHTGSNIEYRLRLHGVPMRWISEITAWQPPHLFIDTQLRGPYAKWHHQHRFFSEDGGTRIQDEVHYALPFGLIGELAHKLMVRRQVEEIFEFRQRRLAELLRKPGTSP